MPAADTPLTGLGSILAPEPVSLPSHARVASTAAPAPFAVTAESSSSPAAAGRRRPNFQYDLSDIDRAHSISYVSRLHKDPRCPLDPVYTLASIVERPVTPPRFVRDALDCSDIDRARPTLPPHRSAAPPRTVGTLSTDIVGGGATPLARYPPVRKMQSSSLESRDITNTRFVTSRCTDPLDPVYSFGRSTNLDVSSIVSALTRSNGLEDQAGNTTGNLISFGAVDGAKARKQPAAREAHNASLSLRSEDISSPAAAEWSWSKPRRSTWRDTTNTRDVPGAQTGADRSKMSKTTRHIDPNTRNYDATLLGGSRVGDNDGMVHVHRHVLDGSPHAASWKPSQGEPEPDAAGISMWRSGNFTAGMLKPKPAAVSTGASSAPVVAAASAAPAPAPKVKQPFGAPAEDGWIKESAAPAPLVRAATPVRASTPAANAVAFAPAPAVYAAFNPAAVSSASVPSSSFAPAASAAAVSASASTRASLPPNLSYPADARRAPPPQKRHVASAHSSVHSNLLSHPPSTGRETEPIRPDARVQPLTFGVRGPFAVPTERASIAESQAASTLSAASTAAGVLVAAARSASNSRSASRPSSRNQLQPAAAERPSSGLSIHAFSPTASTLSNAFSLAFVPTSTGALPASLPFSSPVSRPGLGTIELFERNGGGPTRAIDALARTQERKMQTLRAQEINQVRLLA